MQINSSIATDMLATIKDSLDGGTLVLYHGPTPALADSSLDTVSNHTELVRIEGGTFDSPVDNVLSKDSGAWSASPVFAGANESEATLAPTFFRMVGNGDDPAYPSGPVIQGSVGGPSSAAELRLPTATVTNGSSTPVAIAIFNLRLVG